MSTLLGDAAAGAKDGAEIGALAGPEAALIAGGIGAAAAVIADALAPPSQAEELARLNANVDLTPVPEEVIPPSLPAPP